MKIVNRAFNIPLITGLAVIMLATVPAWAGLRDSGAGPRAVSMGQAQVAVANDANAVTYNPACLVMARERWELSGRSVYAQVAQTGYFSHLLLNGVNQEYPYASYKVIGALIPMGKRLTVGVNLAEADDWTLFILLNSGPRFSRYVPTQQPSGSFGFGLKVTEKFSVGFTQLTTLHLNASTISVDVNALLAGMGLVIGEPSVNVNPYMEMDVLPGSSYQFGGLYRPFKWLSLGANYTYKNQTKVYIPIFIPGGLLPETHLYVEGVTGESPPQVSFGLGLFPNEHITLAFDMAFDMWSHTNQWLRFRSNQPSFNTDFPDVRLEDVWVPKFGVEYNNRMKGRLARMEYSVRTGYLYSKSPYPTMPAGTNNIDNNAHNFSGGFAIGYHPKRRAQYVGVDYFFEYISLVPREHRDLAHNPAVIISEGWVSYSGFALTLKI